MADIFMPLLTLSECVMSWTMIMADIFPPFSIIRKCVFLFHVQRNQGWHVSAIFNYQEVRINTSWAAQSWLTCSCHFWLSAGAYFHSMSCTIIMADMFPPFSFTRKCVFIFHERQNHGWHVPATFNPQTVRNYSHFICDNIKADLLLRVLAYDAWLLHINISVVHWVGSSSISIAFQLTTVN